MARIEYKTGSRAFFDRIEGFIPHDTDWVSFDTNRETNMCIHGSHETTFIWKEDTADEILEDLVSQGTSANPASVILFLIPEIIERIGMTFDKLSELAPFIEKLDYKHKYIEVIYNAYLDNGDFTLTEEQLQEAYENYLSSRTGSLEDTEALRIITQGE